MMTMELGMRNEESGMSPNPSDSVSEMGEDGWKFRIPNS